MQFQHTRVDIEKTRAAWPGGDFAPALVLPRAARDNSVWHVIDSPVDLRNFKDFSWGIAAGDEYIRIPLFQYNAPPQGDLALAFACRLGMLFGAERRRIKTAHILTGNPAELVYNTAGSPTTLAFWLGAAFTFEE